MTIAAGGLPNHHYDDNMPPWKMTIAAGKPLAAS
jgi:hypothetical protein